MRPEGVCQGCGKPISYHDGSGKWNHINTEDAPSCQGPKQPSHQVGERCQFRDGECPELGTTVVKAILGLEWLCDRHARYVRMVEAEWDQAEAEYYGQR